MKCESCERATPPYSQYILLANWALSFLQPSVASNRGRRRRLFTSGRHPVVTALVGDFKRLVGSMTSDQLEPLPVGRVEVRSAVPMPLDEDSLVFALSSLVWQTYIRTFFVKIIDALFLFSTHCTFLFAYTPSFCICLCPTPRTSEPIISLGNSIRPFLFWWSYAK